MNISDTTVHKMVVQVSSSPKVCFCTIWGNRTNPSWAKIKKTRNL